VPENFKVFYACTSSAWTTHIEGGKAKIWCMICGNKGTATRRHLVPYWLNVFLSGTSDTFARALNSLEQLMPKGTVKWFNPTKGYGFIQPQGGGKDVFVHISAVEQAGLASLNEGQVIEYEEVADRGKTSAGRLKVQR
jgi:cold shock protein